jgi:hypothetical protein
LINYADKVTLDKLLIQLIGMIKYYGFRDMRFLSRLILITENLKISHPELYEKYETNLKEIEEVFVSFNYAVGPIWWDKNRYCENQFTKLHIEKYLKEKYEKVELTPVYKNIFHSDLKINGSFVDFVGPHNISHYENLDNSKGLTDVNTKYERKKLIFEKDNQKIIYVPYKDIIGNLDNVSKYI